MPSNPSMFSLGLINIASKVEILRKSRRSKTALVLQQDLVKVETTTVVNKLGSGALAVAMAVDQRMVAAV